MLMFSTETARSVRLSLGLSGPSPECSLSREALAEMESEHREREEGVIGGDGMGEEEERRGTEVPPWCGGAERKESQVGRKEKEGKSDDRLPQEEPLLDTRSTARSLRRPPSLPYLDDGEEEDESQKKEVSLSVSVAAEKPIEVLWSYRRPSANTAAGADRGKDTGRRGGDLLLLLFLPVCVAFPEATDGPRGYL